MVGLWIRNSIGDPFGHPVAGSIPTIVRSYKSAVANRIHDMAGTGTACRAPASSPWHRNYYEIIVRDATALDNIRAYIRNNPANWDVMRYGEPCYMVGNRALLDMPKTAFFGIAWW